MLPWVEVYQRPCTAQRLSSALNSFVLTSVNVDHFQFSVVRRLCPAGEASVPMCSSHFENAVPFWLSCFTCTETVGLLGTGAQDGHLHFHTAPDF